MKSQVYCYIRWSSDQQESGDSERRQIQEAKEYASRNGLKLADEGIIIDPGLSAFTGDNVTRGRLGKLLEQARHGKLAPGTLLVENLDRLSRRGIDATRDILRDFAKAGIDVVTLQDGIKYPAKESGLVESIFATVKSHLSKEESDKKQARLAHAWANKRKNAQTKILTKKVPAWLQVKNGKLEIIPERAKVIKRIFQDAANGIGAYSIAKRLNDDNVSSFSGKEQWFESYVTGILSKPKVIGQFQPHKFVNGKRLPDGEPIKDYFPRVIDDDLFNRVQQGRSQRKLPNGTARGGRKGTEVANLFSGIPVCGYCGAGMRFVNKTYHYLICANFKCERVGWRYADFESSFLQFVEELDIASIVNADQHEQDRTKLLNDVESCKGKITVLEARREAAFELIGSASKDYIRQKLDELSQQIVTEKSALEKKEQELQTVQPKSIELQELQDVIKRVQGKGEDVYKLRAAIACRLKSLVSVISVATVGDVPWMKKMEQAIKDGDLTEVQEIARKFNLPVKTVLKDFAKLPSNDNPWFTVNFRNEKKKLMVEPNAKTPGEGLAISVID